MAFLVPVLPVLLLDLLVAPGALRLVIFVAVDAPGPGNVLLPVVPARSRGFRPSSAPAGASPPSPLFVYIVALLGGVFPLREFSEEQLLATLVCEEALLGERRLSSLALRSTLALPRAFATPLS